MLGSVCVFLLLYESFYSLAHDDGRLQFRKWYGKGKSERVSVCICNNNAHFVWSRAGERRSRELQCCSYCNTDLRVGDTNSSECLFVFFFLLLQHEFRADFGAEFEFLFRCRSRVEWRELPVGDNLIGEDSSF